MPPERTFAFGLENAAWVLNGLSYQAWGDGGYVLISSQPDGIRVEFKAYTDLGASVCYISREQYADSIRSLECAIPERKPFVA
jgi:hypothetical protein